MSGPTSVGSAGRADPYRVYRDLRGQGPVVWWEAARAWLVHGHEAVAEALREESFVQTWVAFLRDSLGEAPEDGPFADLWRSMSSWFLALDAEAHGRMRRQVAKLFTPRRTAELTEDLEQACARILDRHRSAGRLDVVTDLAHPFTASMIAALLALPPERAADLQAWSDVLSAFVDHPGPATATAAQEAVRGMAALVDEALAAADDGGSRILSALLAGQDDGTMTAEEVAATAVMLLFAGHHTTSHLIGNAVLTLWSAPGRVEALRAGGPEAVAAAVEEVLRLESPVVNLARRATRDVVLAGVPIAAGDRVVVAIAGANHDPTVFAAPDAYDVDRGANRHLAFGIGAHFCLGASLARSETKVAVSHLLELPGSRLAGTDVRWRRSALRGLEGLPLAFDPH